MEEKKKEEHEKRANNRALSSFRDRSAIVMEYFQEKEDIRTYYIKRLLCEQKPIHAMWKVYLKYEDLVFQTWEEVDGILERMAALVSGAKEEGIGRWILSKS